MKMKRGQSLIIAVFIMTTLSLLSAFIMRIESFYMVSSVQGYREAQVRFLTDAGLERGKQLISDSGGTWRPPDPPGYLREHITIPPGGRRGWYDIYVRELSSSRIKLIVSSGIEE